MSQPSFYESYWVKSGDAGCWTPDLGGTNPDEEKLFAELLRPGMKLIDYGCGNGERYGRSMAERGVTYHGFDISKTALNAVTRIVADEAAGTNVLVNSVCPGWVKTDMGGPEAELSTNEAADTIVWLATLPDGGPTGGFFRDKSVIPW